ncbi:MAG: hypothetical protein MZV64_49205 [Ignavibacteriales bacterium]|nr:hypothetical protein [Ignavibacteriales bacterium]
MGAGSGRAGDGGCAHRRCPLLGGMRRVVRCPLSKGVPRLRTAHEDGRRELRHSGGMGNAMATLRGGWGKLPGADAYGGQHRHDEQLRREEDRRHPGPHCLPVPGEGALKQFGGAYEVVHHATFLEELVRDRKPKLGAGCAGSGSRSTIRRPSRALQRRVRRAAQRLVAAVSGSQPVEMPRSHDRSFCVVAGRRPRGVLEEEGMADGRTIERTEEALALRARCDRNRVSVLPTSDAHGWCEGEECGGAGGGEGYRRVAHRSR